MSPPRLKPVWRPMTGLADPVKTRWGTDALGHHTAASVGLSPTDAQLFGAGGPFTSEASGQVDDRTFEVVQNPGVDQDRPEAGASREDLFDQRHIALHRRTCLFDVSQSGDAAGHPIQNDSGLPQGPAGASAAA